ncbi:hypothetical protein AB3S75_019705 [Citrus x aurantiifolia]
MGKSPSSSLKKKKRSKISSQVRIKKRRKSRTRRSNKLKKVRCCDDSVSYSSDCDGSRSSVSISSSSFEGDYRSKRSCSRMQKDVKVSKKRRRRSSSCERIEDSPHVKKRKGSKKNDDFRVKKKRLEKKKKKKKKKSRRGVSVSSSGSGSWSCSTCNRSSDEREIEKNRGRSERKYKDGKRLVKVKNESKSRRSRSRSSSLCSQFSEYSDHNVEDKLAGEANSRRLRSVIAVVREGEDVTGMFNDEHKEEMVYDHDDYPSSRSNDSIDAGSNRELVHNSHVASEEKKHEEIVKGEAVVSNIRTCKVTESHRNGEGHDGSNPSCDRVEMNDDVKGKRNQDSGSVDGYDLESILRQKALENLKIRRGCQADAKVPITQKDVISCEVNTPSTINSRSSENRFSNGDGDELLGASHAVERSSASADLSINNDKISDRIDNGKGSAKHDVQYPPDLLALASSPKGHASSETNNPTSVVLVSKPELSSTCTTEKQLFTLKEPPQAESIAGDNVDKTMVEATPTVNPLGGNNNDKETKNVSASDDPSSCTQLACGGTSSKKPQDETNEGSQYQQKTMTVMRGGEMVEVSYKVYIPKKAPALARRQLKR